VLKACRLQRRKDDLGNHRHQVKMCSSDSSGVNFKGYLTWHDLGIREN